MDMCVMNFSLERIGGVAAPESGDEAVRVIELWANLSLKPSFSTIY